MPDLKMPRVNSVTVAGRLTRDPELKTLESGMSVCKLGLAMDEAYRRGEEWIEDTVFIDVTAWKELAERVGELRKGDPVLVEGKLRYESWTKDGVKQSRVSVTAHRVQRLAWPGEGDKYQPAPHTNDDRIYQPEGASDGLPF